MNCTKRPVTQLLGMKFKILCFTYEYVSILKELTKILYLCGKKTAGVWSYSEISATTIHYITLVTHVFGVR